HQKIMDQYQISKAHMPYIMMLNSNQEGMNQHELSEKSFLDKAHTSRALKELQEKEILVKEDINKYKNKFRLTPKGLEIANAFKVEGSKMNQKVFESLTKEELEQLRNIITKLYQSIE
ncbi:MAG: MarR family transcriptional regulator, partial [Firmicutes bacterium]|nr:MarR family transcriptional regulator [Bacillota bacterium]